MGVEAGSLEQVRFKGEFGYDNKILDVCDRVAQEKLPADGLRQLEQKVASVEARFEFVEQLDIAMSFLQRVGGNKDQPLMAFLQMFQIKLDLR